MIEINWGSPITCVVSQEGDIKKFTTIEEARYWLLRKWPVVDRNRGLALDYIDAAMHCLATVGAARTAFVSAAKTAGLEPALTVSGNADAH